MNFIHSLTRMVIKVLIFMLSAMLIYSILEFILLVSRGIFIHHAAFNLSSEPIDRNMLFLGQVQGFISAALLITILIELIYSLIEYLKVGSANYLSIIIEIALIAIIRHILAMDLEHVQPEVLLGVSSLILVLGFFYLFMTKRISFSRQQEKQVIR